MEGLGKYIHKQVFYELIFFNGQNIQIVIDLQPMQLMTTYTHNWKAWLKTKKKKKKNR